MARGPFITNDFLLNNEKARELYHDHAKDMPIIDYHCHLPPKDVAEDRQFGDLFEIWLEGDHYKWRAMRSNGVDEKFCTGDADHYDKFLAWAKTAPKTIRNPLYHWTHLELKRYFDIDELLDEKSAPRVWNVANDWLARPENSARGILTRFKVKALCTTDDPTDSLEWHKQIASAGLDTEVRPAFRPDKALMVSDPDAWNKWVDALGKAADMDIDSLAGLEEALRKRHDFFHQMGCRLSDHGLERCFADFPTESEARKIFEKARSGKAPAEGDVEKFASHLMLFFGRLDAEKGWVKQLHLGAMRNNNSRLFEKLGPDTGFDSIGDFPQARSLSRYLDRLDVEKSLPKTILYNLDPSVNHIFGTMLGNFQDGSLPGKMQLGSGWWFLDNKDGMERQLNTLSNLGLLSRFVGMLTDSRSFMSFPRHEYFRRVLCNLVGQDIENGEVPDDNELVGGMIEDICYNNARDYFGFGG